MNLSYFSKIRSFYKKYGFLTVVTSFTISILFIVFTYSDEMLIPSFEAIGVFIATFFLIELLILVYVLFFSSIAYLIESNKFFMIGFLIVGVLIMVFTFWFIFTGSISLVEVIFKVTISDNDMKSILSILQTVIASLVTLSVALISIKMNNDSNAENRRLLVQPFVKLSRDNTNYTSVGSVSVKLDFDEYNKIDSVQDKFTLLLKSCSKNVIRDISLDVVVRHYIDHDLVKEFIVNDDLDNYNISMIENDAIELYIILNRPRNDLNRDKLMNGIKSIESEIIIKCYLYDILENRYSQEFSFKNGYFKNDEMKINHLNKLNEVSGLELKRSSDK